LSRFFFFAPFLLLSFGPSPFSFLSFTMAQCRYLFSLPSSWPPKLSGSSTGNVFGDGGVKNGGGYGIECVEGIYGIDGVDIDDIVDGFDIVDVVVVVDGFVGDADADPDGKN
jgi:hypothetical protein